MESTATTQQKTIELIIWAIGMVGVFLAVMPLNGAGEPGFIAKQYVPFILIVSMVLITFSLVLEIKRTRKSKRFSIYNHLFEILRTVGGLAFAIYALLQNS